MNDKRFGSVIGLICDGIKIDVAHQRFTLTGSEGSHRCLLLWNGKKIKLDLWCNFTKSGRPLHGKTWETPVVI